MKEHIQDILVGGRPMTKLELANKEIERLNNIIKEAREYIEHAQNYGKEKIIYVNGNDILEILDKENNNEI